MSECHFCGCDFSSVRTLPGGVKVCACNACHEDVVAKATRDINAPWPVEVQREVSAAIDALAQW